MRLTDVSQFAMRFTDVSQFTMRLTDASQFVIRLTGVSQLSASDLTTDNQLSLVSQLLGLLSK